MNEKTKNVIWKFIELILAMLAGGKGFKISQYACAVLLIVSSIALVAYQVVVIDDVSNGLLVYVAQAFLLVGSIFGLDYYVKLITRKLRREGEKEGNVPQSNVL